MFCSNNYLGLTHHPEVINVANEIIKKYGTGSGASRLISGHNHLYKELENTLAKFKEVEAALVFSTGYTTNIGVISALVGRKDAIFCDKLAHASIIDGCLLSGAKIFRFKHNDLEHLKWLLEKETQYRRRLIITEGVFSMDGDLAPLPEIYELGFINFGSSRIVVRMFFVNEFPHNVLNPISSAKKNKEKIPICTKQFFRYFKSNIFYL